MPRPIWKGSITFGLVNIPVILYPAEKRYDIQFKLVDSRDKAKIRYVRVNEQTGEEVSWEDIAKGYEYNNHEFVLLKNEDFKNIEVENSKTIDIESFVAKKSLDYLDFDKPYYLVPDKKGIKGYVILRDTLRDTDKLGITRVVIHTRQYLAALMPYDDALVLLLLRYHDEIRKPSEFELPGNNLKQLHINNKELEIAKQLINSMTKKWKPDDYHNQYRQLLQDWIEEKIHHEKTGKHKKKTHTVEKKNNVINIADLLKKSLAKKNSHVKTKSISLKNKNPKKVKSLKK